MENYILGISGPVAIYLLYKIGYSINEIADSLDIIKSKLSLLENKNDN